MICESANHGSYSCILFLLTPFSHLSLSYFFLTSLKPFLSHSSFTSLCPFPSHTHTSPPLAFSIIKQTIIQTHFYSTLVSVAHLPYHRNKDGSGLADNRFFSPDRTSKNATINHLPLPYAQQIQRMAIHSRHQLAQRSSCVHILHRSVPLGIRIQLRHVIQIGGSQLLKNHFSLITLVLSGE